MSRSAVLTGRIDARDRAKLRGRLDTEARPDADPFEELWAWLNRSSYGEQPAAVAARVDLDEYLRRTGYIEIPAHERLRHLAIHMEYHFGFAPEVLDRIYEAGLRLEPHDHLLWHSRGITTKYAALCAADEATRKRLAPLALRWLERALELDDTDPGVPYSIGKWHYFHGSGGSGDEAWRWFERTLELDPEHGWALLYRAHCLHDKKRFGEALAAYEAVPLQTFDGPRAWWVDVVLEAKADCRLHAGDRAGAVVDFARLLERLEREPHRRQPLMLHLTREACEGPLREELGVAYQRIRELDALPR